MKPYYIRVLIINTSIKYDFLFTALFKNYWLNIKYIGTQESNNIYEWGDGHYIADMTIGSGIWGPSEPDQAGEFCVAMYWHTNEQFYAMVDTSCDTKLGYICQQQ